jgi:hypothetical protein
MFIRSTRLTHKDGREMPIPVDLSALWGVAFSCLMKEEVYEDDPTDAVLQGLNQKTCDTCQALTRITGAAGQQIL